MALVELAGRLCLATIFLVSGLGKVPNFARVAEDMARHHVPLPEAALIATILIEILGGLLIAIGLRTRMAASIVALWLAVVTVVYHTSLVVPQNQDQTIQFLKNLAIIGGLLVVVTHGAGTISVDARPRRTRLEV